MESQKISYCCKAAVRKEEFTIFGKFYYKCSKCYKFCGIFEKGKKYVKRISKAKTNYINTTEYR